MVLCCFGWFLVDLVDSVLVLGGSMIFVGICVGSGGFCDVLGGSMVV